MKLNHKALYWRYSMEKEIILVKGTNKALPLSLITASIGVFLIWVSAFVASYTYDEGYFMYEDYYYEYEKYYSSYYDTFKEFYFSELFKQAYGFMILIGIAIIVGSIFVKKKMENHQITVTSKRVYGETLGQKIEFNITDIQTVETCILEGVLIKVDNKAYNFYMMKNQYEIIKAINYLKDLNKPEEAVVEDPNVVSSLAYDIERLSLLKELLDLNLITLEDFNKKKKEILNI